MSSFDSWLEDLTQRVRQKQKYNAIVDDCEDHLGADFCRACGEEVDDDGNTESRFEYCSRNCGCYGTSCPMGGKRVD